MRFSHAGKLPVAIVALLLGASCAGNSNFDGDTPPTSGFVIQNAPQGVIGIRGDTPPLSWENTVVLSDIGDGQSDTTLDFDDALPLDTPVEFKLVAETENGIEWESISNRRATIAELEAGLLATWDEPLAFNHNRLPDLTAAERVADAETVIRTIETLHPGLLRALSEAERDKAANDFKSAARDAETIEDWLLATFAYLGVIECDHTTAVYNQGPLLHAFLFEQADRLPLASRIEDSQLVVTGDATADQALPTGTRIIEIDAVAVSDILERLIPLVPADGPNDNPRIAKLALRGVAGELDQFGMLHNLAFPTDGDHRTLTVIRPGENKTDTVRVDLMTHQKRSNVLSQRYPDNPALPENLWRLDHLDQMTSVLTIGTFGPYQLPMDAAVFLENSFADFQERGTSRLIVDIRGSEGGDSRVGTTLSSYLTTEPCTPDLFAVRTRFIEIPDDLNALTSVWDGSTLDLSNEAYERVGPYYQQVPSYVPRPIDPHPLAFTGKTIVVTSPRNKSASFYFANTVRVCGFATLAGETTGGALRGINGGSTLRLRLPHSGLIVNFPFVGTFSKTETSTDGVEPDIALPAHVELDSAIVAHLFGE